MIESVPALQTMYEIFPDILCLVVLNLLAIIEINTRLSVGPFITMCCCIALLIIVFIEIPPITSHIVHGGHN